MSLTALLPMMVNVISEEDLLDNLVEAIEKHKIAPNEKTKSSLEYSMMLLITKFQVDKQGLDEMLSDLDKIQKGKELMKRTDEKN